MLLGSVLPRARSPIVMIIQASIRKLEAPLLRLYALGGLALNLHPSRLESQRRLPVNCAIKNSILSGGRRNNSKAPYENKSKVSQLREHVLLLHRDRSHFNTCNDRSILFHIPESHNSQYRIC
jgi:hypothetical protein